MISCIQQEILQWSLTLACYIEGSCFYFIMFIAVESMKLAILYWKFLAIAKSVAASL